MSYGYVYKFIINNKIYIGKHKYDGSTIDENYWGSGILWNNALSVYGKDAVKREILEWCDDRDSLNEREEYWISFYNSTNRDIGYNIALGGEGGDIYNTLTDEQKANSLIKRKKYWDDHPDELREIRHRSQLGHKVSDETKDKISKSRERYWEDNYDREVEKMDEYLHTDEVYKKISEKNKIAWENKSEDEKNNIRDKAKDRWNDSDYRDKQHKTRKSKEYLDKMSKCHSNKGQRFIYNKTIDDCKMVHLDELDEYLNKGYTLGQRPRTEEQKNNSRIAALNRKSSKKEGD